MECEEFILPDWSPPDDPARVLAAEGRRNPSDDNDDDDDDDDGEGEVDDDDEEEDDEDVKFVNIFRPFSHLAKL